MIRCKASPKRSFVTVSQPTSADRPVATRRRGAMLEHALLDAAWQELQESGYAKLTMERVADRAGTSRAVIYRRWRNRPELVIAAMRHRQPVLSRQVPDTGTLRAPRPNQPARPPPPARPAPPRADPHPPASVTRHARGDPRRDLPPTR